MGKQNRRSKGKYSNRFNQLGKSKKKAELTKINKKSLFNRYKDKQLVREELKKKEIRESKLRKRVEVSASEDEDENPFSQLLMSFGSNKKSKIDVNSESESVSDDQESDRDIDSKKDDQNSCGSDKVSLTSDNEHEHNIDAIKDEATNETDPYSVHYCSLLTDALLLAASAQPVQVRKESLHWPKLGDMQVTILQPNQNLNNKKTLLLEEDNNYAIPGQTPNKITELNFERQSIHTRLRSRILNANKDNLVRADLEGCLLTPFQIELFSILNNYQDLYYPERSWRNSDEIRLVYCMHIANHVVKSTANIRLNDVKVKSDKMDDVPEQFRDRGLVRPTVLILLPFRSAAYKVVKMLGTLISGEKGELGNGKRFNDEYSGNTLQLPKAKPKPEDYELTFSGNTDDNFKLGMAVTKKTLKLFTDFYSSDIIVASPLGLRSLIGAEGELERDYDFLSSIELMVVDQAEVLVMQNWEHVLHIFQHMHLQPQSTHDTDFSRVRSWAVNGWAKYYRQTSIFSSIDIPEIWSILTHYSFNYTGRVRIVNQHVGCITQVIVGIPQMFHRFKASNPLSSVDERFRVFIKELLPRHGDQLMGHTLIYVPSYFDYVKIRNYFKKEDISFVQICEYSKDAKVARARDIFFHSESRFLLYSERAHFFHRRRIKGIRHIIFYQPPTIPHFYVEMVNLMQEANQNKFGGSECNMSVTTLYCNYDVSRLSSIVGNNRVIDMLEAQQNTHMLVTGS